MPKQAELSVTACNIDYPHDMDYILDRPPGYDTSFVFIHFLTPFEIRTVNGIEQGGKNDCILYTPDFAQWNRGLHVPLRNNWMHFEGEGVDGMLNHAGLPRNTLFRPEDTAFIEPSIGLMRREIYERRPSFEDALRLRLQLLILELGRVWKEDKQLRISPAELAHVPALRTLRAEMMSLAARNWSAEELAAKIHLSRSRFTVLYAKIFGIPPMEDLLAARLQNAQRMLSNAELTVEAIAARCGFNSAAHFHRMFRRKIGCTPREYVRTRIGQLPPGERFSHHLTRM